MVREYILSPAHHGDKRGASKNNQKKALVALAPAGP